MRRINTPTLALCASFLLTGCYDFWSEKTIPVDEMEEAVPATWTGVAPLTTIHDRMAGLAGRQIWRIDYDSMFHITGEYGSPIYNLFGGDYTLTSLAQFHRSPWGDVLIHGNRTGEVDEFRFVHTNDPKYLELDWVSPIYTNFIAGGQLYGLREMCEIIARPVDTTYGSLNNPDIQAFISFRAKRSSSSEMVAGVMEIDFVWDNDESSWRWFGKDTPPGSEEEKEIWVRQINGETFSNECMPINVTRGGKQTSNYLVVADPSEDEITLFDASSLSSGPLDSYRAANPLADITDIVIEGRGGDELNDNYAFVVTLWENIEEEKQLEHILVMDGDIDDYGPFLLEDLPETTSGVNAVNVIGTRGAGADYAQESLFTLGDRVVNRVYHR